MKITITGHRPNKLGNDYDLTSPLIQKIKARIEEILGDYDIMYMHDPTTEFTLITGMALGIDTLFAKIAIEYEIPFTAAIPCTNQDSQWPTKSRNTYHQILSNSLCTQHLVTRSSYTNECMQLRNEWMVDNCDLLIAVFDNTPGGTANCVNYAKSKNKEIIYINPKEL